MKYIAINKSNIDLLYKLNKKLAAYERQSSLFVAKKEDYKRAFICKNPVVFGVLIYKKDKVVGFIIYSYKFATYLASKVIYIEDIYFKKRFQTDDNIKKAILHMIKIAKRKSYARVEIRVLNEYGVDKRTLKGLKFQKIKKWDVYRHEV